MPVAKRVAVDEDLCGRSQTKNERIGIDIGFSAIEIIARVVATECNPLKVGASVQQV